MVFCFVDWYRNAFEIENQIFSHKTYAIYFSARDRVHLCEAHGRLGVTACGFLTLCRVGINMIYFECKRPRDRLSAVWWYRLCATSRRLPNLY